MYRPLIGIAALLLSVASSAQPVACPSVQWTPGQKAPIAGYGILSIAAVDYDEDGKLDLVATLSMPNRYDLVWWRGAGDKTFGPATVIATDSKLSNVVVADATGDGRDDVLVGLYSSSKLLILPGSGSGRGETIERSLTIQPWTIFAVNRDADAAMELAVADFSYRFAIYDDIAGAIVQKAVVQTDGSPLGIVSADFDADGYFDVAVVMPWKRTVAVYFGKTKEAHDPPAYLPAVGPWELSVGDLDADGKPDLVARNVVHRSDMPAYSLAPATVSIYRNQGGRNFTDSIVSVDRGRKMADTTSLLLADVSGDGHLDLVTGTEVGTTTAVGAGDGTFRTPTYLLNFSASASAAADFDGDGRVELAFGSIGGFYTASASCTTQTDLYTVSSLISIGQQANLTAHVSGLGPDTPAPRGTVTLRHSSPLDSPTVVAAAPVDAEGEVSFSVSGLQLGKHSLTAEFGGNAIVAGATSNTVIETVTSETTDVTITLPDSPAVYGQPFPIRVTVESSPHDQVTLDVDGVKSLGFTTNPLNLSLDPGSHTMSAKYLGSAFVPPGESAPVTFNVARGPAGIRIIGTLTVKEGQAHSLWVNITGPGATKPGGSVQVIEGTTVVATRELTDTYVTIDFSLPRGAHEVRIHYLGDSRYLEADQNLTLEVLPNSGQLVIEARGLPGGIHIASVMTYSTDMNTVQLLRRAAGTAEWVPVTGWNPANGMDPAALTPGVTYEYQLHASQTWDGYPMTSNLDSAVLFHDDLLAAGTPIRRAHFAELRTAVNLMRAQASLPPFDFEADYDTAGIVRAAHFNGLRTALTEARQHLAMNAPAFSAVGVGTQIRAQQIQELRELAR